MFFVFQAFNLWDSLTFSLPCFSLALGGLETIETSYKVQWHWKGNMKESGTVENQGRKTG